MNRNLRYILVSVGVLCLAAPTISTASGGLHDIRQDSFDVRLRNGTTASALISEQGVKITFNDKTVDVLRVGDSAIVQTQDRFGLSTFMPDLRSQDYNPIGDYALDVEDYLMELDNLVEIVQPMGRNSWSNRSESDNFSIDLERAGKTRIEGDCTSQSLTYVATAMAMAAACSAPVASVALCGIAILAFISAQDAWIECMRNVVYDEK